MRLPSKIVKNNLVKKALSQQNLIFLVIIVPYTIISYYSIRFTPYNIVSILLTIISFIALKFRAKNGFIRFFAIVFSLQVHQVSSDIIHTLVLSQTSFFELNLPLQFYCFTLIPFFILLIFLVKPNYISIIILFLINLFRIFYQTLLAIIFYDLFFIQTDFYKEEIVRQFNNLNFMYLIGTKVLICATILFLFFKIQTKVFYPIIEPKFNLRKILIISAASSFILIWFNFGLYYQQIAYSYQGQAFTVNDDIKYKGYVRILKKDFPNVSRKTIDNLIRFHIDNEDKYNNFMKTEITSDEVYYFQDHNIGMDWGNFYLDYFQKELNASHYKLIHEENIFKDLPPETADNNKPFPQKVRLPFLPKKLEYYFQYKLILYDFSKIKNEHNEYKVRDFKELEVKRYTIWFDSEHNEVRRAQLLKNYPPCLRCSRNYLDLTVEKIFKITQGRYYFPLIDFLYFSAVTITTLGYGDILPNSNIVRILVMIESLLGVFLAGLFLSSLFLKKQVYRRGRKLNR